MKEKDIELYELVEEKKRLEENNRVLLSALNNLQNPVFVKDEDARFVFFNQKYQELFGMNASDYIGKTVMDLTYLPLESRYMYKEEDNINIKNTSHSSRIINFSFSDGEDHLCIYWSIGFKYGNPEKKGLVGEIVDITKEKQLQEQLDLLVRNLRSKNKLLANQALVDNEMGIFNKNKLIRILKQYNNKRHDFSFLLLADIDYFKRVNDTFGHIAGDDILKKFAKILLKTASNDDIVIRYGGEEFLIFIKNNKLENVLGLAELIRHNVEKKLKLPDGTSMTTSIGVSPIDITQTLRYNIKTVDKALYKAKEDGRNCVRLREIHTND